MGTLIATMSLFQIDLDKP